MGGVFSKKKPNQILNRADKATSSLLKRLFTLKEGAEYLGRSEWGMRELIWSGKIPVIRAEGGRKIFLDIRDLDEFIDRNKSTYL
jgi:hypothetical protein